MVELERLWHEHAAVVLAAALALAAVAWRPSWRLVRTVVTIAHEGGHAAVAVAVGRGLTGIRLHPDTSGVTVSTGAARGPGLVLTLLAGYPAPALLGVGAAALVAADRSRLMLWVTLGLLTLTLVVIRNAFGALAVLVTGAVVGYVAGWAPVRVRDGFAAALCWFLVFGALRATSELRRGRSRRSDAAALARLTHLPRGMWAAFFWLVASVAVLTTVGILFGKGTA